MLFLHEIKEMGMKHLEIRTIEQVKSLFHTTDNIQYVAFQHIDFNDVSTSKFDKSYSNCLFLGCILSQEFICKKLRDCTIFPSIDVPYTIFIPHLYTPHDLYAGYKIGSPDSFSHTFDQQVYSHYIAKGKETSDIKETLARRIHDHSISDALHDFLVSYEPTKLVAIMGGHNIARTDIGFLEIAKMSKTLTEQSYLMLSGGGPGAMEATHFGAWMAGRTESELLHAYEMLSEAPHYDHLLWLEKAFMVMERYPQYTYESIGIPTWFYGHEPPTPFATRIAKYFENSIREDGLLAIAKGGIIFTPGNAGTIQEIFQDANQNHYLTFGLASPMIFYNADYWTHSRPIYPLLTQLFEEGKYKNLILSVCNNQQEVLEQLAAFALSQQAE